MLFGIVHQHMLNFRHVQRGPMKRLRKRAERYLKCDATSLPDPDHDVRRLYHELRVHQVELELQNEELRRAKDELEAVLNERISFYRALSHDLAQPIFALGLLLKSLEVCSSRSERAKILTQIASSSEMLKALSRSLSELTDGRGTRKSLLQEVSLQVVMARALNDHLAVARAKGLRIGCVASSASVITDPLLLHRIVTNLISNAVKYTERGGVVVGVRRAKRGRVRIEVWDTGVGIAPEAITRIYDEFWQADNPERNFEKGLGLGLTIARRLADELGATLSVRSTPRRGSVFALTLPVSAQV